MNRSLKDIDTVDNTASDSLRMFLMSFARINRSFVLIVTIFPWFLVAAAAIVVVCYQGSSMVCATVRGFLLKVSGELLSFGRRKYFPSWGLGFSPVTVEWTLLPGPCMRVLRVVGTLCGDEVGAFLPLQAIDCRDE
jgi:hypothetical protein